MKMLEKPIADKLLSFAGSSLLSLLILYLLNLSSLFWIAGIIGLFLVLRSISFHVWIPAIFGVLGLILFGYVDQTLEIYRSLVEDTDTLQVFLGTFNIFWLSIFIWNSGRLLTKKKIFEEDTFDINGEKSRLNIKVLLGLPRLLGLLPFGGLITGLFNVCFGATAHGQLDIFSDIRRYEISWFIVTIIIFVCLNALIFYHKSIQSQLQKQFIKHFFFLNRGEIKRTVSTDDGLFTDSSESIIFGIALFWFSALTIPIVKQASGVLSVGVIAVFSVILALDFLLYFLQKSDLEFQKYNLAALDKQRKIVRLNFLLSISIHSIASLIFLFFLPPLFWADFLGSISIAALSFSSLTVIAATIYYWGYDSRGGREILIFTFNKRIPAISLLLLLAIVSSQLNLNDNHEIRYLNSSKEAKSKQTIDLQEGFEQWFNSRLDKNEFKARGEYPVYVVTAQGGGIYAAYHAATTLAKLHDGSQGKFSNHVFAISSVSGGSVGSSIYSSLVKATAINTTAAQKIPSSSNEENRGGIAAAPLSCESLNLCVRQVLSEDLLSPLLSLALFSDLLQRFIPARINDWDRVRGLELAMEGAWDKMSNANAPLGEHSNPLSQQYNDFWQPDGQAPALVLNTTVVETGERLVLSPFTFPENRPASIFNYGATKTNMPLSTAAVLSARFPVVTPAGWFRYSRRDPQTQSERLYRSRLVDGGYYDNSGVATARDLLNALETSSVLDKIQEKTGLTPKFINISIVDAPQPETLIDANTQGINEILSPLRTAWNVRGARARSIIEQVEFDQKLNTPDAQGYQFRTIYLDKKREDGVTLPLGWMLSETSRIAIEKLLPSQNPSSPTRTCNETTSQQNALNPKFHNYCVSQLIYKELGSTAKEIIKTD